MAKPNQLWIARTQLHRLVRWIDGVETEFCLPFDKLTDNEKMMIAGVLKNICRELDDYYETEGMPSAVRVIVARTSIMNDPKVN